MYRAGTGIREASRASRCTQDEAHLRNYKRNMAYTVHKLTSQRVTALSASCCPVPGHKSAAWADWAAHFFSSSSTSLTRKLLPMAFQHMQQQGHGKQRSGEHHLVSWWARLISKVLFGPISSTLVSAPYPRMQQHGGPETMLVR